MDSRRYSTVLDRLGLGFRLPTLGEDDEERAEADDHRDDAADGLIAYLKQRSHRRVKKVFLVEKGDYKGKPISVRGIQKRIEYYAKKSGISVCCHRLRHTMATDLLNAEAEVETIQDQLGLDYRELSMGMSHDFVAAIEEGATLVRIGTAIFGPRQ